MKHTYQGTPFSIETSKIENKPGTWNSTKIQVFYNETNIGEYIRHYPNFVKQTFYPFQIQDEWYALYSADYTATRVAKLTEIEFIDWCGEEGGSLGFCPTEFYVPRYKLTTIMLRGKEGLSPYKDYTFDNEFPENQLNEYLEYSGDKNEEYLGEYYTDYGFLCGCYWGDDTSWKLRFIDLKGVPEKNLVIEEKFGYFELPGDKTLRECVRNRGINAFELNQMRSYNLGKNKFWDEEEE